MTRINLLKPALLTDQHLLAEHRELPRIFGRAYAAFMAGRKVQASTSYTLGKGHVVFFYDKLQWLATRHHTLTLECVSRGFKVQQESIVAPSEVPSVAWEPTAADVEVNLERLQAKMAAPPRPDFYRHRGQVVPAGWYDAVNGA